MLRNSKFGRALNQSLLPATPTINDFNDFLDKAFKLKGHWVNFSWKAGDGKVFTISLFYSVADSLPIWRLCRGSEDEGQSLLLEHQTCDVPLIFNLMVSYAEMSERAVRADRALSYTRGRLGAEQAQSHFYCFGETHAAEQSLDVQASEADSVQSTPLSNQVSVNGSDGLRLFGSASGGVYPKQLVSPMTGILTFGGFLLLLEREYELAKRADAPLALLLISAKEKSGSKGKGQAGASLIAQAIPYITAVQRKTDTLADYKRESLAMLLPGTSIQGAMAVAGRISRALDAHLQSLHFSFAVVDVSNDALSLNRALVAAECTSKAIKFSQTNLVAYRDLIARLNSDQLAKLLNHQSILGAGNEVECSSTLARLKEEMISSETGVFVVEVARFFLEHDRKRALREQRRLSAVVLDPQSEQVPLTGKLDHQFVKAMLKCLGSNVRKTDILAEYDANRFVLILPDSSLSGAKSLAERMKKQFRSQPSQELSRAAETRPSMYAVDVMTEYPTLSLRPI
jgi:GGDEF domain-containing protein